MSEPLADTAPGDAPDDAEGRPSTDSARLRSQLRQAEARAERAERALERMERSAKYTVGSLFVEAARSPRRLVLLPRDLWRVWRLRKSRRGSGASTPVTRTRRDEVLDLDAARLLLPRASARPDAAFTIVGALNEELATAWSPYAAVTSALPHEAAEIVSAVGADVVVIDSAAALPGQPWSFLGDPAAADRQIAAQRLVDAARERGIPVVLLRTTSPAHTAFLEPLASQCDLILDGPGSSRGTPWNPGIDPAAWPMAGAGVGDRAVIVGTDPLTHSRVPLADRSLIQALAHALHGAGIHTITPDPRYPVVPARRAALASSAFGIASPLRVAPTMVGGSAGSLGTLASGRRLLGSTDVDLDRLLPRSSWARVTVDADTDLVAAIAAARVPLGDDERRLVLREILLNASVPVALDDLSHRLGLRAHPKACWDVSLVLTDPDVDAILLQSWRPREVLVSAPLAGRAHAVLAEHGIGVVVTHGAGTRDDLSLAASCPLVAAQVEITDPHAIADLLVERIAGMSARARPSDAALWSAS
ncbi:MAG: hypothetical protein B7C55_00445 [Actinomycetales bacterium mxb001]|nr:MAG: hypothetical protein B7C55_00445 [Actinomycetales bacterium mxb001]